MSYKTFLKQVNDELIRIEGLIKDPSLASSALQTNLTNQLLLQQNRLLALLVSLDLTPDGKKISASAVPTGAPSFEWAVTSTVKEFKLDKPWKSFTIKNDGAGNVKMGINETEGGISKETTVDSGETLSRDFGYPFVTKVYLATETAGTTATVRIFAEEGNWL